MILQQSLEKFRQGDSLSNTELDVLLKFHREMVQGLERLGTEFNLATYQLRHRLNTLEGFKRAREQH